MQSVACSSTTFRTATPPRMASPPQIHHSRKSPARHAAAQAASNRRGGKTFSLRGMPETKSTPSSASPAPTHSPKLGSADADCSRPLRPRDSRKSARGVPNRSPPADDILKPTRRSLPRSLPATCAESSSHAAEKNRSPGKSPSLTTPPASRFHPLRSQAYPAKALHSHCRKQMCWCTSDSLRRPPVHFPGTSSKSDRTPASSTPPASPPSQATAASFDAERPPPTRASVDSTFDVALPGAAKHPCVSQVAPS